ncbi:hypothetical protein OS493_000866 [Desmophyllum pertusum]|uniref:Uncharacterized protein n=1 Tax=Desmophyllum pertusum TaxID=174260 RepID=A0A9W9ZU65_9CNID|nr:hypothetical protein OS493_000866 [Desmophyllum pertusum]
MPPNRQPVITLRSASGVVISPDMADVVEEDGMSAVESYAESNRITSGTSEGEDSSCEDSKAGVENGAAKKTTRDSETTERHGNQQVFGPALLHRLYGIAASPRQDTSAVETSVDSNRNEGEPPRLRSTIRDRFCLVVHHRLVKLTRFFILFVFFIKRSRNCGEWMCTMKLCVPRRRVLYKTTPTPSGSEHERMAWPVYNEVSKLPFSCLLREHRYNRTSKLRIHTTTGYTTSGDTSTQLLSVKRSPGRPTCPMMLSFWAAYDTYHHCGRPVRIIARAWVPVLH